MYLNQRRLQSVESRVLGALVASALVVIGLALATWKLAADSAAADGAVFRTQEVLNFIGHAATDTLQIELSTQTYRITGEAEPLRARDAAIASRAAAMTKLGELTRNNPAQQERWVQLKAVMAERLAISKRVEDLVKSQGKAAANEYIKTAPLKETRERVAQILGEMDVEERELLVKHIAGQQRSRNGMVRIGIVAAFSLVFLLGAAYFLLRRQLSVIKRMQAALVASEKSYAATLLSIGDAVVATDLQACITRMNGVAERLTGWTLRDAVGRPIEEVFRIIHEKTGLPAVIPVSEVLDSGEIRELANHTNLIARDGTQLPIADSAAPIRDDSGQILGVVLVFRDMTKEHRAEQSILEQNQLLEQRVAERTQQLQESETRYKTAFLTSPDSITITSLPNGLYLDVNEGFVRTYGWSREEAIGKSALELRIWKDVSLRQQFIEQMIVQGVCENIEAELVTRSGQVITTLVSARHIQIDGQNHMLSVVRDISERQRVASALEKSEEKFRLMAEAVPHIIWITEPDGSNIYFNQQWVEYTGLRLEESHGQGWTDPFHPDDRPRAVEAWRNAVQHNGTYALECRLRRADGQYRWWLVRGVPAINEHGEITNWYGTCTNIDDLKHAEMELRLSEERLNFALEHSHIAGWDVDLDSRVAKQSSGHHRLFGYPDNHRPWSIDIFLGHIVAAERESARAKIQAAVAAKSEVEIECQILAADGTTRWLWVNGGYRVDAEGRAHLVGIVQDISVRKLEEAELVSYRIHLQDLVKARTTELDEAKRAAEIASLAKSRFLANMSHEIRTPLSAIAGMSWLVRREPLSPAQLDRLNKLDRASEHLRSTIDNILDLSKIEASKLELADDPVRVDELVASVLEILELRANEKGLQLKSEIGQVPPHLYGDPTRLRQALLNYASNALKFTHTGSITVRLEVLEDTASEVLIRWEVQDTGIGLETGQLDKLFQAFVQADGSTSRQYGGTGLGLAITRLLAEAMGGEAGASGAPGIGCTFWFTSRLRKGAAVVQEEVERPIQDAAETLRTRYRNLRALLVDDDALNQEIGQMILEDVGIIVDLANDGQMAIEMAQQVAYDVILMDMQMPRVDGMDATRAIRNFPTTRTVPIIAMTANAFMEDKALCFASGMNDFITKPFDPQLLYAAIVQWVPAA